MLAGLAHFGPMRLRDATNIAGPAEPTRGQLRNFDVLGVAVRYGNARMKMMAFNPAFPAMAELRRLVLAVEPAPPKPPSLPLLDEPPPESPLDIDGPRNLFGSWRQTAVLLTIGAHDGSIANEDLRVRLLTIGTKRADLAETLKRLADRDLVVEDGAYVRLHPAFAGADALIAFAHAFLRTMPPYRLEPRGAPEVPGIRPLGKYKFEGDGEGIPLLFGRAPRYRILATLAVQGPMTRTSLAAAAKTRTNVITKLIEQGWIRQTSHVRTNLSRVALTIANIPAREPLLALLRRMAERWPPAALGGLHVSVGAIDPGPPRRILAKEFFGSEARSNVLLTLFAMGQADVSMLDRAIKVHDIQEVHRAIWTFEAYGIIRGCRLDGRQEGGFEMNPDWFAAAELRALLEALVTLERRYRARAEGAESAMPPRRLKRKINAQKKERRARRG